MLGSKIRQAWKELDVDQQQFLKDKEYTGYLRLKKWLKLFKGIARYDEINDDTRTRSSFQWAAIGAISILLIAILFFVLSYDLAYPLFIIPAIILALILGIYSYHRFSTTNIINHLRKFAYPVLYALHEDIHPASKMRLHLDFTDMKKDSNLIKQTQSNVGGTWYAPNKIKLRIFEHHWGDGKIRLRDNTIIDWEAQDEISEITSTRKRTSGKVKTKTKHKVYHRAKIKVAFDKSMYQLCDPNMQDPQFYETTTHYIFTRKIKEKQKGHSFPTGSEYSVEPEKFLTAIMQTYKLVSPIS